jgi:hypothetical protein
MLNNIIKTKEYCNLLNQEDFNKIKEDMLGIWFPWYFFKKSVPDEMLKKDKTSIKFIQSSILRHRFYDDYNINSNFSMIIDLLIKELSAKTGLGYKIKAAYANLLLANNVAVGSLDVPHVDRTEQNGKSLSGVFYMTNSVEGTTLYNEYEESEKVNQDGIASIKDMNVAEIVKAEENKLVLFDCRTYHSAPASCIKDRLAININIDIK